MERPEQPASAHQTPEGRFDIAIDAPSRQALISVAQYIVERSTDPEMTPSDPFFTYLAEALPLAGDRIQGIRITRAHEALLQEGIRQYVLANLRPIHDGVLKEGDELYAALAVRINAAVNIAMILHKAEAEPLGFAEAWQQLEADILAFGGEVPQPGLGNE